MSSKGDGSWHVCVYVSPSETEKKNGNDVCVCVDIFFLWIEIFPDGFQAEIGLNTGW